MQISQRIGNIYTGSIFSTLVGLLISGLDISNKNLSFFSYGSGLCSTLMTAKIHENILSQKQIEQIKSRLINRIKISP
jgi:3-hydroxy-3-methylglutaryl CoA synthase